MGKKKDIEKLDKRIAELEKQVEKLKAEVENLKLEEEPRYAGVGSFEDLALMY